MLVAVSLKVDNRTESSPLFVHIANQPIKGALCWLFSFSYPSHYFLTFPSVEFLPNKWLTFMPLSQGILSEHKLRQWWLYFMGAWLLTHFLYVLNNNPSLLFPLNYKSLSIFSYKCQFSLPIAHITGLAFVTLSRRYCVGLLVSAPSCTTQDTLHIDTT